MHQANQISGNASKLSYRAEVDGLRAIAVISVILYHAQLVLFGRDWFEGGYIGVDIFFVISGYLITRIILSELNEKGSFSFLNFYERRVRRILPMLFVVMIVSFPFGWLYLLPTAFVEFSKSIFSSIGFFSNFFFWSVTTEYDAENSLLKPLLHIWSLSVEEQFYIVFPILAIIAFKYFRSHMTTLLLGLLLLSLQFSEVLGARDSNLNFYLPFSRFWELAVGSFLAIRELSNRTVRDEFLTKLLPVFGLYLVLFSIIFFDNNTPHPGFSTLIPTIGVALIIGFSSCEDLVGKVLGSKPFVWVGLVSYSAYLWHFPIFAFARIAIDDLSVILKILAIVITLLLAFFSYLYIEQPFRKSGVVSTRLLIKSLSSTLLVLVVSSALAVYNDGFKNRFEVVGGFENYEIDNKTLKRESWSLLRKRGKESPNFKEVPNKVLIVGNSHAKDIFNVLHQNISGFDGFDFLRGMIPQLNCFNETIKEYENKRRAFYESRSYRDATTILVSTRYRLTALCFGITKGSQPESSDLDGLKYLIKRAKKDGKNVVVMGNHAEFRKYNKKWVADHIYHLHSNDKDSTYVPAFAKIKVEAANLLYKQLNKRKVELTQKVKAISQDNNVSFYDKLPLICDMNGDVCDAFTEEGHKMFYDYGHFTLEGAKSIGLKLLSDSGFKKLLLHSEIASKVSN